MGHKLGIIGYGGMASWHHKNSVKVDGLEVVAAYDIDPERVKAAEENGLKGYHSLEEFLKDDSFDMVLVATPNNFHKELAVAAMDAGKHTISEKPVAMSVAELDEMIAASERNHVLFSVHQNRRWDRDFRIVMEAIRQGSIGKPYTIESRVHGQNGVIHGWRAYKVAGGGMLLDWGVHLIDQMMFMITEPVTQVYCQFFSIKTEEVDDYFKLILRFASGLSAQIEVGTYCLEPMPRWYVNGHAGSILVKNWDCEGKIVKANQYALEWEPEVIQTSAGPTRTMAPRPKETLEELPLPQVEADWSNYYKNVMAAIDQTAELIVKPCQVRRVFQVIEAAFASEKSGGALQVNI